MPSRRELANAVRVLSMDAVQKANSGHPGAPMGLADVAEVLWNDFLSHNPADPLWTNRDRFVLSNGHASMLLYSLLHLSGYDLDIQDLKNFRQLHSRTPGHPEFRVTPGVETTTGPLGQGMANAVGMALAERILGAYFNQGGHTIVDHWTYVVVGDGCLMEGVTHEACSLAGTLGLGKLIALYDDNGISIDGQVDDWFSEETAVRFEAYGWHVISQVDGHDPQAISRAIAEAREVEARPSLICFQTKIAYGSPHMMGSHKTHGAPLGEEEVAAVREHLGWSHDPFCVPQEIYSAWNAREKGKALQHTWQEAFVVFQREYPDLATEYERRMTGRLPDDFSVRAKEVIREFSEKNEHIATRKASKQVLEEFGPLLPELFGGSADLSGSNQTLWSGSKPITKECSTGNYLHYGVREFSMAAIMSGMSLHGGVIPYGGTFLVFSDYARSALRMAALMGIRDIFVLSHDSIGVGEDGPTHQPIEHAASLRLIPNLTVWRPCDAVESAVAWKEALEKTDGPTALLLSRQGLSSQARSQEALENISRGGYILFKEEIPLEAIIIATGSEVDLAVQAAEELKGKGRGVRVVSLPSVEVFEAQDAQYKESILPKECLCRVIVEAGSSGLWYKYAGSQGAVIGLDRFGESAPGKDLFSYFDFTVAHVVHTVEQVIQ
jgi:transketolase